MVTSTNLDTPIYINLDTPTSTHLDTPTITYVNNAVHLFDPIGILFRMNTGTILRGYRTACHTSSRSPSRIHLYLYYQYIISILSAIKAIIY